MGGLTEGTEKQDYWFGSPFVDQTDVSDTMQSVVCTGKIGGRKTGNKLKSVRRTSCAVPRRRWRVWMEAQRHMEGPGVGLPQSPRTGLL